MAEGTGTLGAPSVSRASQRHQRAAWVVLLAAFMIFCIVCLGSGLGLRYFLLDSTVSLQSILTVGRGTAGLTGTDLIEQVVRYSREISNSSVITTDRQSQATLSFYDPYTVDTLVTSVTVRSDTAVDVGAMSRPRFEVSGLGYEIAFEDVSGRLKVVIPDGLNRPVRVTIQSSAGNWITLNDSGVYFVDVSSVVESVTNYRGDAALISADGSVSQVVSDAQRGLFYPDSQQVYLVPAPVALIESPTFTPNTVIASDGSPAQLLMQVWRCYSVANEDPVGTYTLDSSEGRQGLALQRGGGARSHGETRCSYTLNAGQGIDVRGFDTLSLDVAFKINSHSLSACGVEGSECPLMIRVDYIPATGGTATWWVHGFYASFDPALNSPLICPNCTQEHEAVNPGAWYSYQSDNLFSLIPPNQRPVSIVNVVLYASGHEYDVFLTSAELFGGYNDPQQPAAAEGPPIATATP
ncbi:MAG: hypothetical protein U0452_10240 [Anaerolineae bacterium]